MQGVSDILKRQSLTEMLVNVLLDFPAQGPRFRLGLRRRISKTLKHTAQQCQQQVMAERFTARAVSGDVPVHHIIDLPQVLRLVSHRADWRDVIWKQGVFPQSGHPKSSDPHAIALYSVFLIGYLIVNHSAVVDHQISSTDFMSGFADPKFRASSADQQDFYKVLVGVEDTGMGLVRGLNVGNV